MFALEVEFLTGRYVATAFDNRGRPEWPPHPARVFSALVATHFEHESPDPREREALAWLEAQGAPHITASPASERDVVTVFVPVNDLSVLPNLDDPEDLGAARRDVEGVKSVGGKALAKAEQTLRKLEAKVAESRRRATAAYAPGREPKDGPGRAAALLPERRLRQPRTFPSVTPDEPLVVFAWPDAHPTPEARACLDELAARVVRLGHSSSFVSLRLREDPPSPTWSPSGNDDNSADVLRVTSVGQLAQMDELHARTADAPGRVMPATFRRYAEAAVGESPALPMGVFGEDWVVFRRVDVGGERSPRLPSTRGPDVARVVRRALLKAFGPEAPEILTGHADGGAPSARPHLALVPLPFLGHDRADGSLMGLALVMPRTATRDERRSVHRAIEAWAASVARLGLVDEDEASIVAVHLGRAGVLWLRRVRDDEEVGSNLRAQTWCAPSRAWATATPVALDRNPGDLRAPDPVKEAAAFAAAEETIAAACERVGLPRPAGVIATPSAPLAGGDKVRAFGAFTNGLQRVLVHAKILFSSPVRGPVLLGAGRYLGLGLFRPVRDYA